MDKTLGEDEVKGLEDEIDSAVERLFVEIKKGLKADFSLEPQVVKPPQAEAKKEELDLSFLSPPSEGPSILEPSPPPEPPPPPPPKVAPSLNPLEKLEAQVLSLEWEMTRENLKKAMEEVGVVKSLVKGDPQITSTLDFMGKIIQVMMKNEGDVPPPFVKFLLDAKETLKLFMKKEKDQETTTFKQLVYAGMEARFATLARLREAPTPPAPARGGEPTEAVEGGTLGGDKVHELLGKINLFLEKAEVLLRRASERARSEPTLPPETKAPAAQITVFKIGDQLLGVESEKIFKVFKVPESFGARFSNEPKIRLKGLEVRMIDLKKRFSIATGNRKEGVHVLTVNDQGEVKGWIIDQILKQVSGTPEREGEGGRGILGKIDWIYKNQHVTVPILDTKKL